MAFSLTSEARERIAIITLFGELDASVAGQFRDAVDLVAKANAERLVLDMTALDYMASAGLRALVFAKQKMGANVEIFVVGAHDAVYETIEMTGFIHSVFMLDTYDAAQIEVF
jgi:anti-anti-sigma factor